MAFSRKKSIFGRIGLRFLLFCSLDQNTNVLACLLDILQDLAGTRASRLVTAFELLELAFEVFDFLIEIID